MIQAHRSDHGQGWLGDDIGGVRASAQSDFKDQPVGGVFGEEQEGGSGRDLEKGDRFAKIGGLGPGQGLDQGAIIDRLAVEQDALVEIDQMGRGIDVDALALGARHLRQEGTGRALAIGSGDMDRRRQLILRIAQRRQEALQAPHGEIDFFWMQPTKPRKRVIKRLTPGTNAHLPDRPHGRPGEVSARQGLTIRVVSALRVTCATA